jgi:hypothetical protein
MFAVSGVCLLNKEAMDLLRLLRRRVSGFGYFVLNIN